MIIPKEAQMVINQSDYRLQTQKNCGIYPQ